jgi:hypothetical protein
MRRISRRSAAILALSVLMVFAWVVPALAGTAYSNYSNFTCGSYGYRNRATVTTSSSGASAGTYVERYPSASSPAGWLGCLARLYNSSGTLVKQSGYSYNDAPTTGFGLYMANYTAAHGAFYSYGISKSYTGTGYHGHATWTSPYQDW